MIVQTNAFVKAFLYFAATSAIADAVPSGLGDLSDIARPVEHVTLVGTLLMAVAFLWRNNQKKDARLEKLEERTAEALEASTEATREMRSTISNVIRNCARQQG